jgi:hypothetical protein
MCRPVNADNCTAAILVLDKRTSNRTTSGHSFTLALRFGLQLPSRRRVALERAYSSPDRNGRYSGGTSDGSLAQFAHPRTRHLSLTESRSRWWQVTLHLNFLQGAVTQALPHGRNLFPIGRHRTAQIQLALPPGNRSPSLVPATISRLETDPA